MEKKMLSIIVPIYNTEKYIERCLISISNQTYSNFEVLLIDDGSTDGVSAICQKFCDQDSRFRYIHKENQGVSIARNLGLRLAKGSIIGFVDSDDSIVTNMYEYMIECMEKDNADIVICDSLTVETDGTISIDTIPSIEKSCCFIKENISPQMLGELAGAVWRCIYKKEVVDNITFPENLKLSEDRIFNLYAFGKSNKITYIKEALYQRFCRNGSAVYRHYDDMFSIVLQAYKIILKALQENWSESYKVVYDRQFIMNVLMASDSICSVQYKSSFFTQYQNLKLLCNNSEVTRVVADVRFNKWNIDTRIKWIRNKKYLRLMFYITLVNLIKHR